MTSITAGLQTRDRHIKIIGHTPKTFVFRSKIQSKGENKRIILLETQSSGSVSEPKTDNKRLIDKITPDTKSPEFILHFENRSGGNYKFIE